MRLDWGAERIAMAAERAAWQAEQEENRVRVETLNIESFGMIDRAPLLRCDISGKGYNRRRSELEELGYLTRATMT